MKNLLSNKTLQATYGGDVIGGSVVPGMLGAFCISKSILRPKISTSQDRAGRLIVASQDAVIFSGTGVLNKG